MRRRSIRVHPAGIDSATLAAKLATVLRVIVSTSFWVAEHDHLERRQDHRTTQAAWLLPLHPSGLLSSVRPWFHFWLCGCLAGPTSCFAANVAAITG
jgi:hypothetical protein